MSSQAEDEQNTDGYTCLETAYSPNGNADSFPRLNFSSMINIVNDSSTDANEIGRNPWISSDLLGSFDDFLKQMDPNLEYMGCDELPDVMKMLDEIEMEQVDRAIGDRSMSIEVQPASDIRRRYETDGKRQIENSRSKPMAIKLPSLKNGEPNCKTSFWVQLEYHIDDASTGEHGSVRIPLTPGDIQDGIKQLDRISIIKKKLDSYTFQLIPFDPLSTNSPVTIYEDSTAKSVVAKAKRFRETYNLAFSRIACQLLIKQNDTWRITDISCQTNVMEEKKAGENKLSNKRSTSSLSNDDHDYQTGSNKNKKKSPRLIQALPVALIQKS